MLDGCYELSMPTRRLLQEQSHGPLTQDLLATNSLFLDGLRTKGRTIMYKVIVVAFCFAIVFVGLLLITARVDSFPGYQLICLTPPG